MHLTLKAPGLHDVPEALIFVIIKFSVYFLLFMLMLEEINLISSHAKIRPFEPFGVIDNVIL